MFKTSNYNNIAIIGRVSNIVSPAFMKLARDRYDKFHDELSKVLLPPERVARVSQKMRLISRRFSINFGASVIDPTTFYANNVETFGVNGVRNRFHVECTYREMNKSRFDRDGRFSIKRANYFPNSRHAIPVCSVGFYPFLRRFDKSRPSGSTSGLRKRNTFLESSHTLSVYMNRENATNENLA